MANNFRGVDEIARQVVKLAGEHRVTCERIIQKSVSPEVRSGFLMLVRGELRARECAVVADQEYEGLVEKGAARPFSAIWPELEKWLPRAATPTGGNTQPALAPAPLAQATRPKTVLSSLDREALSRLQWAARQTGTDQFSAIHAVEHIVGELGTSSARVRAVESLRALARAGLVNYDTIMERVTVLALK